MNTKRKDEQPEDVELLLPWHAAGSLSRRDAARVEQALANDNELARRYELVREELGEAIRLNESLGAPSARAMEALFAKIDAEPARKPRASFSLSVWMAGFVASFQPRTLAYAGIAAALAIVIQGGVLTGVFMSQQQASGPTLASHGKDMPHDVLIRFNPQASADSITAFLQEFNAVVVDGPSSGTKMYRLRIGEKPLTQPERIAVVNKMAQNRQVVAFTVPAAQQ